MIATGFLCASAGLSWAKVELGSPCNQEQYLMLYYGVCDKVTISTVGDADRHCIEWRDEKDWKVENVSDGQIK